jgi:EAL domain-containing protein (putative c-di-GMP-specific phosphodiesterase class I)
MMCGLHNFRQAASLIHGLAVIVRNLGISLVAEGIETSEELIALQGLGCDLAQGGYFGCQMKSEEMAEFLCNAGKRAYEVRGASPFAMRWAGKMPGESLVDNLTWTN